MKRVAPLVCLLVVSLIALMLAVAGLSVAAAGALQSQDPLAPPAQASLTCPAYSTDVATTGSITVSWQAIIGAAGYHVEVKVGLAGAWTDLTVVSGATSTACPAAIPGTYFFRACGVDDAGQGTWSTVHATIVPTDDAAPQVHYRGSWSRTSGPRSTAFLKTLHSATKAGATASFTFRGRSIALICVTGPGHGKAAVYLDGSSRAVATIDTNARATRARQVVYSKKWATPATHTITLKVLGTKGRATVALDAIAAGELDSAAPTGDFSFSGDHVQTVAGQAYANAPAIALSLQATDNVAVSGVEASTDSTFTGAAWELFAGPLAFQLSGADGPKSVSVRYRDDAGNLTPPPPVTHAITLDTTAPSLSGLPGDTKAAAGEDLAIAADASDATSGLASLKLYYRVAGAPGFLEADFTADLGGGYVTAIPGSAIAESPLQYYVVATDLAGNATPRPLGAPDTLYTVTPHSPAPTGGFSFSGDHVRTVAGQAYATAPLVSLALQAQATDDVAVSGVETSADPGFADAVWVPFADSLAFRLSGSDGSKSVFVRYRDDAGHVSPSVTDTITLDTTEPSLSGLPEDMKAVTGQDLAITASASDATSGLASLALYYRAEGGLGFTETAFAAGAGGGYQAVIPGSDIAESQLRYYVVATDVAGNSSSRPLDAPVALYTVTTHLPTAPGNITGTVRNPSQVGLADIDVTTYQADGTDDNHGWNAVSEVFTLSDGTYDLTGLAPGKYRLVFIDDSGAHQTQCYDDQSSLAGGADITVAAAATTSGVDVTLARAGDITGTVTDSSLAGLAGIEVTANQADGLGGWNYVSGVQTESDGTYDLSGLAGGTYQVGFDDLSGVYLTQCYNNKAGLPSAVDVKVTVGSTTSGVDATLARAGDITGRVTDASQIGLAGIDVTAYQADGADGWSPMSGAITEADGTYDLNGLLTGDYRLEFSDGSGNHLAQYYDGAADLDSATDIAVIVGGTASDVDATLADTAFSEPWRADRRRPAPQ